MSNAAKYRIESGTPRRVFGARQKIQREAHTLAVQTLTDVRATTPDVQSWVFDVRRGRMSVYGGILRFIELLHRKGVSLEKALLLPAWLEEYIRALWNDAPAPVGAMPIELVQTGEHRTAA